MSVFQNFHEPGVWLVISALCGVALLAGWPFTAPRWRAWVVLAYWLLIPYLTLITGAVSPRLMGLRYLDWSTSFQVGAALILVLALLVAATRLLTIVAQPGRSRIPEPIAGTGAGILAVIGLCGAEEFFWSFLRAALWEIALFLPQVVAAPAYWAVWSAALLALPVAVVVQPSAPRRLSKIAILIVTSVVFFYTRNFWLCWFLHATIWLILAPIAYRRPRHDGVKTTGP